MDDLIPLVVGEEKTRMDFLTMDRVEQAVVLAAGEGERLRPFTAFNPKVMLPVGNRPILDYVVEALDRNGVRQIVMVVGYRKEQVLNYFGSGEALGVDITYVVQEQQLGTAHALKQARGTVKGRFLVLGGDNIIEPETIAGFVHSPCPAILVKPQRDVSKYGVVKARNGVVEDILEKVPGPESNLVNTGIYSLDCRAFEFIGDERDLPAVLCQMVEQGHNILVQETPGPWLDAVYPWDMLKLNQIVMQGLSSSLAGVMERNVTVQGPVSIGQGTLLRANSYIVGPVVIGNNCEIGPGVCLFPATAIGDNSVVFPYTQIYGSIIGSNVTIGPSSLIKDSIIASRTTIGANFVARTGMAEVSMDGEHHEVSMGVMVGEEAQIGDMVVVDPGVFIGNRCQLEGLVVLRRNLPDQSVVL